MRIIVSVAMSLDGFIGDDSSQRLVLSSPEDFDAVYRLRAESDVVLVGGETVRVDNPSLATRHLAYFELREQRGVAPHPMKATITRSGNLPPDAKFFTEGTAEKLVFCGSRADTELERRLESRAIVVRSADKDVRARSVIADLESRGVSQLMIEGGARTIQLFFQEGLVDAIRLAVAPVVCGARGRGRPFGGTFPQLANRQRTTLRKVEALGDTAVMWYELERENVSAG
jgi:5-amino-6-(5-phosphoribosylamino)uracil reductase